MLSRLEVVRLTPSVIVDIGAGPGILAAEVAQRYPKAIILALDLSWHMLHRIPRATKLARWLGTSKAALVHPLCADFERLPLASASVDWALSNLAMPWCDDVGKFLAELRRILKPGGLLMFTTLGPDTLRELSMNSFNAAFRERLLDMHDLGDLLVKTGFTHPVMDQEHLTLTYSHPAKLLADIKSWGGTDLTQGRHRGLHGKQWRDRVLLAARSSGNQVAATLEVVYGHAWTPERAPDRLPDGRSIVRIERASRS